MVRPKKTDDDRRRLPRGLDGGVDELWNLVPLIYWARECPRYRPVFHRYFLSEVSRWAFFEYPQGTCRFGVFCEILLSDDFFYSTVLQAKQKCLEVPYFFKTL